MTTKKRILATYDQPGWAFHRIALRLQEMLPQYQVDITSNRPIKPDYEYDALIAVWWGTAHWDHMPEDCKRYLLVYDHWLWKERIEEFTRRVHEADCVFASNHILERELLQYFDVEVLLAQDGIDCEMFRPIDSRKHNNLVVGWAGNSALGEGIKGRDILEAAIEQVDGVEFVTADPADMTWRPYDEMPDWYADIDVLVCASENEGTPNPVLEAAACGKIVLSTLVGIVPEMESRGVIVVERDADSIASALRRLRDDSDFDAMGKANREHVKSQWTWRRRLRPLFDRLEADVTPERPIVLVVYDSPGWVLERIALQLQHWLGNEFEIRPHAYSIPGTDFDAVAVVCLTYMAVPEMLRRVSSDALWIVCQFDEHCWKEDRKARAAFEAAKNIADIWLFSNKQMRARYEDVFDLAGPVGECQDGVDTDLFNPTPFDTSDRPLRVGWCGNSNKEFFGDLKGVDLLRQACESIGAEFIAVDVAEMHRPHKQMPRFYDSIDVFCCLSTSEGTPNPVLEAAASGRVVMSTPVGIVPEIPGIIQIDRDWNKIRQMLVELWDQRVDLPFDFLPTVAEPAMVEVRGRWSWEKRSEAYRRTIRYACSEMDTRVILIHCGEPTVDSAREALEQSRGYGKTWDLVEVVDETPMDVAFNRMLELADRTYHIQIDADMVLKPYAIEAMRFAMYHADRDVWQIAWPLWDTLFERLIFGVKIYRSEVAKRYPYQPQRHCETDQYQRAEEAGYRMQTMRLDGDANSRHCLGHHRVDDPQTAYWNCWDRARRWVMLERNGKPNWFCWLEPYERHLLERWKTTGDERFIAGRDGLIAGLASEPPEQWGEKNATKPPEGWARRERFHDYRAPRV